MRVEADDVAEIALSVEIAAKRDLSAGAKHEERYALRLLFESVGGQRHDPRKMPGAEQLVSCRDDSAVHGSRISKRWASRPRRQLPAIPRIRDDPYGTGSTDPWGPRPYLAPSPADRHTPSVRSAVLLAIALAGGPARADREARASDPAHGTFWRDVAEPHRDEVHALLGKAHAALQQLDAAVLADAGPSIAARRAVEADLVHLLRYARRLEPDNVEVLQLLAEAADDTGDARQALEALQAIVDRVGEDRAGTAALDHLGELALRTGRLDDAIRDLRAAQGPLLGGQRASASALVHLATALELRGHTGAAIDVLADALPLVPTYEPSEIELVSFALAVLYDRDEQRGAAFEVLDHMKSALGDQLGPSVQNALAQLRFAPAEDELYYRALLYEVIGDTPEARSEWLLYAACPDAPYRHRALDHAHALDAVPRERRAPVLVLPPPPPGTP